MAHLTKNRAVRWLAPVALAGSIGLVACGDSDSDVTAETGSAPVAVNGSDIHLANQADQAEANATTAHLNNEIEARIAAAGSDVHLENLAAEAEANAEASGSDVHLANMAAEAAEREAHLEASAATAERNGDEPDAVEDEFVPGSRRMPTR